ncbi:MAG: hypothetical protein JNK64_27880 [Myxococcales bacterium]|nr:hypothetical protein [Myxococcales bacterium]
MRPITSGLLACALVATFATAARGDDCTPTTRWEGQPIRSLRAAAGGDRVIVRRFDRLLVSDLAGATIGARDELTLPDTLTYLPTADGFVEIESELRRLTLRRLDGAGRAVGEPAVLATAAAVPTVARADARDGLVAVAWYQAGDAAGIHLRLVQPDGAVVAAPVWPVAGVAAVPVPAIAGPVVWLVWSEGPAPQILGRRFSAAGQPLDAAPVEIARVHDLLAVVDGGDRPRVYATSGAGGVEAFDLGADGVVVARGPTGAAAGRPLVGMASGAAAQLALSPTGPIEFPRDRVATLTRVAADGTAAPLLEVPGVADAVAVPAGDELWLVTAEDAASPEGGVSKLVLRRLSSAGVVVATVDLDRVELARVDGEACFGPDGGCRAGGGGAGGGVGLLVAAVVARRRRSRARR